VLAVDAGVDALDVAAGVAAVLEDELLLLLPQPATKTPLTAAIAASEHSLLVMDPPRGCVQTSVSGAPLPAAIAPRPRTYTLPCNSRSNSLGLGSIWSQRCAEGALLPRAPGHHDPEPGRELDQYGSIEFADNARSTALHRHQELPPRARNRGDPGGGTPADRRAELVCTRAHVVLRELAERAISAAGEPEWRRPSAELTSGYQQRG
jgi:hypothetical protein